jgi:hypothetical protein
MNKGRTIFAQVMDHIPAQEFQKCIIRYGGDRNHRGFSCWDQFLCLAFAQLTYRESLRDIEACLRSVGSNLYHMGFRGKIPFQGERLDVMSVRRHRDQALSD